MANVPLDTRFIGIAPQVNLTERKSALINAETQPYTMQDIVDTAGGGGSYLKYTAVLGQIDEDAPQVIVLENTIGDIVWTRLGVGGYEATLVGAFPENKTWCSAISGANYGNTVVLFFTRDTDDTLLFYSKNWNSGDLDINSNDNGNIVYECSIEIRVYP